MRTPQEFRNEVIGKAFDQDGAFKYQCWDGADKNRVWLNQHNGLGCPQINCTDSGYVRDIWNQRHKSGILNYFIEVPVNAMQDGDWAIWGRCAACPDSHIAIFRRDNGNGTGLFLGQNQAGTYAFSEVNIPYAGLLGALRPKCYVKKNNCPFTNSGTVKALYDGIRVRTSPSTKTGDTGIRYNANSPVLNYDDIVLNDGWYWAKYKRYNGGTGYCALCSEDGKTVYWKQV